MNFNHHQHHHASSHNSQNSNSGIQNNSSGNSTGLSVAGLAKQRAFQSQSSQLHQQLQHHQLSQQQFAQQLSPQFQQQQQQLPFKTYLLNKYGQFQNSPTSQLIEQEDSHASASVLQAVISGSANNLLFDSVLKAPGHPIFNSISSQLGGNDSFASSSGGLHKHHQQSSYISKFQPQTASPTSAGLAATNAQLANLLEQSQTKATKQTTSSSNSKAASKKPTGVKLESLKTTASAAAAAEQINPSSDSLLLTAAHADNLEHTMAAASKRKFSGSNSSLQNSDDDDDLDESFSNAGGANGSSGKSKEEKRRLSHTAAEQKRRNAIKRGYDDLQSIVPACEYMDPSSSQKACKATVLKRSIDYIYELQKDREKHEDEIESLKKEIMALRIMKTNYEEMLQYHRNQPKDENSEISEETKFDLFTKFADNLFQQFQALVSTNSFTELSSSILNWIEHSCSANNLRNLVYLSLVQIGQQILQ